MKRLIGNNFVKNAAFFSLLYAFWAAIGLGGLMASVDVGNEHNAFDESNTTKTGNLKIDTRTDSDKVAELKSGIIKEQKKFVDNLFLAIGDLARNNSLPYDKRTLDKMFFSNNDDLDPGIFKNYLEVLRRLYSDMEIGSNDDYYYFNTKKLAAVRNCIDSCNYLREFALQNDKQYTPIYDDVLGELHKISSKIHSKIYSKINPKFEAEKLLKAAEDVKVTAVRTQLDRISYNLVRDIEKLQSDVEKCISCRITPNLGKIGSEIEKHIGILGCSKKGLVKSVNRWAEQCGVEAVSEDSDYSKIVEVISKLRGPGDGRREYLKDSVPYFKMNISKQSFNEERDSDLAKCKEEVFQFFPDSDWWESEIEYILNNNCKIAWMCELRDDLDSVSKQILVQQYNKLCEEIDPLKRKIEEEEGSVKKLVLSMVEDKIADDEFIAALNKLELMMRNKQTISASSDHQEVADFIMGLMLYKKGLMPGVKLNKTLYSLQDKIDKKYKKYRKDSDSDVNSWGKIIENLCTFSGSNSILKALEDKTSLAWKSDLRDLIGELPGLDRADMIDQDASSRDKSVDSIELSGNKLDSNDPTVTNRKKRMPRYAVKRNKLAKCRLEKSSLASKTALQNNNSGMDEYTSDPVITQTDSRSSEAIDESGAIRQRLDLNKPISYNATTAIELSDDESDLDEYRNGVIEQTKSDLYNDLSDDEWDSEEDEDLNESTIKKVTIQDVLGNNNASNLNKPIINNVITHTDSRSRKSIGDGQATTNNVITTNDVNEDGTGSPEGLSIVTKFDDESVYSRRPSSNDLLSPPSPANVNEDGTGLPEGLSIVTKFDDESVYSRRPSSNDLLSPPSPANVDEDGADESEPTTTNESSNDESILNGSSGYESDSSSSASDQVNTTDVLITRWLAKISQGSDLSGNKQKRYEEERQLLVETHRVLVDDMYIVADSLLRTMISESDDKKILRDFMESLYKLRGPFVSFNECLSKESINLVNKLVHWLSTKQKYLVYYLDSTAIDSIKNCLILCNFVTNNVKPRIFADYASYDKVKALKLSYSEILRCLEDLKTEIKIFYLEGYLEGEYYPNDQEISPNEVSLDELCLMLEGNISHDSAERDKLCNQIRESLVSYVNGLNHPYRVIIKDRFIKAVNDLGALCGVARISNDSGTDDIVETILSLRNSNAVNMEYMNANSIYKKVSKKFEGLLLNTKYGSFLKDKAEELLSLFNFNKELRSGLEKVLEYNSIIASSIEMKNDLSAFCNRLLEVVYYKYNDIVSSLEKGTKMNTINVSVMEKGIIDSLKSLPYRGIFEENVKILANNLNRDDVVEAVNNWSTRKELLDEGKSLTDDQIKNNINKVAEFMLQVEYDIPEYEYIHCEGYDTRLMNIQASIINRRKKMADNRSAYDNVLLCFGELADDIKKAAQFNTRLVIFSEIRDSVAGLLKKDKEAEMGRLATDETSYQLLGIVPNSVSKIWTMMRNVSYQLFGMVRDYAYKMARLVWRGRS